MQANQSVFAALLLAVALLAGPGSLWAQNCSTCDHEWARTVTPESLQAMFDAGLSPNGLSKFNNPLIFLVAMVSSNPDVARTFHAEAKARDEELILVRMHSMGFVENTVLHYAARNESPEMLEYFLELGTDVSLLDDRDKTPLQAAPGYTEDVRIYILLLEAGIDPNAIDSLGWTVLHKCCPLFEKPRNIPCVGFVRWQHQRPVRQRTDTVINRARLSSQGDCRFAPFSWR